MTAEHLQLSLFQLHYKSIDSNGGQKEETKMGLKVDVYEDKRDKEEQDKIWKGKQKHSDSKHRICFQVAYFVIFISLDSYLQYTDKAYLASSVPREQTVN